MVAVASRFKLDLPRQQLMSAPSGGIAPEKVELYDKLVATQSGVERKGASMPYTAVNGNMFSFLTPTGTLALRLPAAERGAFLEEFDTALVEQHGSVMKEYVAVPDESCCTTPTG